MAGMRVFSLDLPGHGTSAGPGCQSVAAYAEKVIEFIDAAGLSRAAFIGHGLGGAIALTLAIQDPQWVAGTGLISSGVRLPIPSAGLEIAANPATFEQAVQMLVEMMHIPESAITLKDQVYRRLISNRQTLFHGDLQACRQFNVSDVLNVIQSPVLVVCGTDDMLTPRRFSETLAGGIPAAALQTIEGAGHLVMLEQPRRVATLLSVFLRTIPYIPGS